MPKAPTPTTEPFAPPSASQTARKGPPESTTGRTGRLVEKITQRWEADNAISKAAQRWQAAVDDYNTYCRTMDRLPDATERQKRQEYEQRLTFLTSTIRAYTALVPPTP